jgi:hypothetical protein
MDTDSLHLHFNLIIEYHIPVKDEVFIQTARF